MKRTFNFHKKSLQKRSAFRYNFIRSACLEFGSFYTIHFLGRDQYNTNLIQQKNARRLQEEIVSHNFL